jgi:hypothetical protein
LIGDEPLESLLYASSSTITNYPVPIDLSEELLSISLLLEFNCFAFKKAVNILTDLKRSAAIISRSFYIESFSTREEFLAVLSCFDSAAFLAH